MAAVIALLPKGKGVERREASSVEEARALVAERLRGRNQTLRCLRRSPWEEIYAIPRGTHAAIQIGAE